MAGLGIEHDHIAKVIINPRTKKHIDPDTLRKYFRTELDTGAIKANAVVAKSLYDQARAGNVVAAIWWTKCRMGWKSFEYNDHPQNLKIVVEGGVVPPAIEDKSGPDDEENK
jgi:hypothetical protein